MKNLGTKFKTENVLHFLNKWIFGSYYDYRVYRILGVATAGGAEAKAEAPRSIIDEDN
jgi:hypothetical protein